MGGRAPLPRGVLALLRARGVPRRGEPAHEEHPSRSRHRSADDEPSGACRRARVARSTCVGHGRVELGIGEGSSGHRAAPVRPPLPRQAVGLGRRGACAACRCSAEDGWEYHGEYFDFPLRNVVPKPLQKPHPPLWVACSQLDTIRWRASGAWARSASSSSPLRRREAWVHAYYNAYTKQLEKLVRLPDEPEHRRGRAASCAPTPTKKRSVGPRAGRSSSSRSRSTTSTVRSSRARSNLWNEYQEWKKSPKGQGRSGPGLIGSAGTRSAEASARSSRTRTSIRSSCSTRRARIRTQTSARASSCSPREVMPEFHATRAPSIRSGSAGAGRRDRARGDRHEPYNFATNQTPSSTLKESGLSPAEAAGATTKA